MWVIWAAALEATRSVRWRSVVGCRCTSCRFCLHLLFVCASCARPFLPPTAELLNQPLILGFTYISTSSRVDFHHPISTRCSLAFHWNFQGKSIFPLSALREFLEIPSFCPRRRLTETVGDCRSCTDVCLAIVSPSTKFVIWSPILPLEELHCPQHF